MADIDLFPEISPSPRPQTPRVSATISWQHTSPPNPTTTTPIAQLKKSFAEAIGSGVVPLHQSNAQVKESGPFKSVRINQAAYEKRVQMCSNGLIGRLVLNKGDSPWKVAELKTRLCTIWGLNENWRLISLGRGYYNVFLPSMEAKATIMGRGVINVKPGIFRLQPWIPDFDPSAQKITNAQVWVRICQLPWEYWDPIILADIAKSIGCLLRIDRATLNGDYGHFARILVDIDLSMPLLNTVGIERDGGEIWVNLEYEAIPPFCPICSAVGHPLSLCRQNKGQQAATRHEERPAQKNRDKKSAVDPNKEAHKNAENKEAHKNTENKEVNKHASDAQAVEFQVGAEVGNLLKENQKSVPVQQVLNRIRQDLRESPDISVVDVSDEDPSKTTDNLAVNGSRVESSPPPVTALEKDITLSPLEGSSSLVKETSSRVPWSSDSEDETSRFSLPRAHSQSFSATHSWYDHSYDKEELPWAVVTSRRNKKYR